MSLSVYWHYFHASDTEAAVACLFTVSPSITWYGQSDSVACEMRINYLSYLRVVRERLLLWHCPSDVTPYRTSGQYSSHYSVTFRACERSDPKIGWSGAERGAGGCGAGTERGAEVTGLGWSVERLFSPAPLRSAPLICSGHFEPKIGRTPISLFIFPFLPSM